MHVARPRTPMHLIGKSVLSSISGGECLLWEYDSSSASDMIGSFLLTYGEPLELHTTGLLRDAAVALMRDVAFHRLPTTSLVGNRTRAALLRKIMCWP